MDEVSFIDTDVTKARKLCKRRTDEVPESSALYALVRYARWTESLLELALFIRYQGARRTTKEALRPFYQDVAAAVDQMNGDIRRARRFLGFLVRAATVERGHQRSGDWQEGSANWQEGGGQRKGGRR